MSSLLCHVTGRRRRAEQQGVRRRDEAANDARTREAKGHRTLQTG